MDSKQLSVLDLNVIKSSLQDTVHKIEHYTDYPSLEFKQQRIKDVKAVLTKINDMLKKNS